MKNAQSNSLRYTATKTKNGIDYVIKIRLNDECKNGHQDFSITGDQYKAGKPHTDRNLIGGGAMGDELAVLFPEFAQFNALHLCDWLGQPMHALANGLYWLQKDKAAAMRNLRISETEFDILSKCTEQGHLAILLEDLGIRQRWALEANKAIKQLEEWTGEQFLCDSVRSNWVSDEKMNEFRDLKKAGYYTPEAANARSEAAKLAKFEKRRATIEAEKAEAICKAEKAVSSAENERRIKLVILDAGYLCTNFIYYNHSNQIAFNWLEYGDKFTPEQVSELLPICQAVCPGLILHIGK